MIEKGSPETLGPSPDNDGTNFALYSTLAERVELCLFDDHGAQTERHDLPDCSNGVWHGYLPRCAPGQRYGYRVHDDNELDSAGSVPYSVVTASGTPCGDPPVRIPWAETIFYECNVRGYTMRHPGVGEKDRGKFSGLRNKQVIEYLKALGITSVELMPVYTFIDERHLVDQGLRNLWGYNTINTISFFAPMPRYANGDADLELRDTVRAIHDAGLEVILDVAYNHTGEGGDDGPTIAFRGIDNLSYYRTPPHNPGTYVNDTPRQPRLFCRSHGHRWLSIRPRDDTRTTQSRVFQRAPAVTRYQQRRPARRRQADSRALGPGSRWLSTG
jgi:glycogen operon protein